jgi:hypothetical protein
LRCFFPAAGSNHNRLQEAVIDECYLQRFFREFVDLDVLGFKPNQSDLKRKRKFLCFDTEQTVDIRYGIYGCTFDSYGCPNDSYAIAIFDNSFNNSLGIRATSK